MSVCIRIVLFAILCAMAPASAQVLRGGTFPFELDFARFRADSGWTYLEIYVGVPRTSLTYTPSDTGDAVATFETDIQLFRGDSLQGIQRKMHLDRLAPGGSVLKGQQLYVNAAFFLRPGTYRMKTTVTGTGDGISGWVERPLEIPPFRETGLQASDVQLSSEIRPDQDRSMFNKNGYFVCPNPGALFGLELPMLFYYAEIYGLSPLGAGTDSTFRVTGEILDSGGTVVRTLPPRDRVRKAESVVVLGQTHAASLESGLYTLRLHITDPVSGDSIFTAKPFGIYRQADYLNRGDAGTDAVAATTSEFDAMTEAELDVHFEQIGYLTSRQEQRAYNALDPEGKRHFLKEFWRTRDSNILTSENEAKQDYFMRLRQAEARFTEGGKPGWQTDRGRIYILYGEPDDIERVQSDMNHRYYETWQYYSLQGGAEFIFVDVDDLGRLRLVHSTLSSELHDYQWRRWLTQ